MKIYIKKSDFNSTEKYTRIQAIIDYVNIMLHGLYEFDEIDSQALEVYFVDFFNSEVNNGGIAQFMHNSGFSDLFNEEILSGLKSLNAKNIAQVFEKACEKLNSLSEVELEKFMSLDMYEYEKITDPTLKNLKDEFAKFTKEFYDASINEQLVDLNFDYVAKFKNLEVIEDDKFDAKMEELLDAVPEYIERLEKAEKDYEENKPDYITLIENVCQQFELELQAINAFDHGEQYISSEELQHNIDNEIWYYHIDTDQGYHYIILDEKKATLINGKTKELVGAYELE